MYWQDLISDLWGSVSLPPGKRLLCAEPLPEVWCQNCRCRPFACLPEESIPISTALEPSTAYLHTGISKCTDRGLTVNNRDRDWGLHALVLVESVGMWENLTKKKGHMTNVHNKSRCPPCLTLSWCWTVHSQWSLAQNDCQPHSWMTSGCHGIQSHCYGWKSCPEGRERLDSMNESKRSGME